MVMIYNPKLLSLHHFQAPRYPIPNLVLRCPDAMSQNTKKWRARVLGKWWLGYL